jgi:hypothetical protein
VELWNLGTLERSHLTGFLHSRIFCPLQSFNAIASLYR